MISAANQKLLHKAVHRTVEACKSATGLDKTIDQYVNKTHILNETIAEWQNNMPLLNNASWDVFAERARQVNVEGRTHEHDDQYAPGELARAAACYALPGISPQQWPWGNYTWKPTMDDPRRMLVKAGALILAEIERIDRAAARAKASSE